MCDYSLHAVASRPARVSETLVTTSFYGTSTRGFAAKSEPGAAVCLLPGTELAFERDIRYNCNWLSTRGTGFSVARFCAVEPDEPHQHHDALSFPDGKAVLVNVLSEGQHARVLQLPVIPRESVDGHAEEGSLPPSSIMVFLTYRPARLATRAPLVSLPVNDTIVGTKSLHQMWKRSRGC
jgi:hypothetical protein